MLPKTIVDKMKYTDEFNSLHYGYKNNSKSQKLTTQIKVKIQQLSHHEIYSQLTSTDRIKCFISYHIFAVWDFDKLLRSLQNKITIALRRQFSECPSEINRLIKEIVFTEESDLYPNGQPNEDFTIYLRAIAELKIDPDCLWYFLESQANFDFLKPGIKELVEFNFLMARLGSMAEITATFFFGREKLTSQLFTSIIKVLQQKGKECPILISYTEKLLQENSPESEILALKLLNYLSQDENEKIRALQAGLEALNLREKLWNYALADIAEIT
ncbi:MAG: DUF3050 domain-containing protein [Pleurocapsa sp. MO_192.B19]|nr:DUF3050 domain-containing protein [Pleurocapsa sp. MO_192.B19]